MRFFGIKVCFHEKSICIDLVDELEHFYFRYHCWLLTRSSFITESNCQIFNYLNHNYFFSRKEVQKRLDLANSLHRWRFFRCVFLLWFLFSRSKAVVKCTRNVLFSERVLVCSISVLLVLSPMDLLFLEDHSLT